MAKRANPFSDDIVQQSKIHVGLKQFNNNEERLEKVYKKTLDILFKGAKKPQQDNNKCDAEVSNKKDGLKQLFIGTNGSLLHSGKLIQDKVSVQCKCGGIKREFCSYCETALCAVCERPCALCQQVFCAQCSLFVSEGSEVCVSCYG